MSWIYFHEVLTYYSKPQKMIPGGLTTLLTTSLETPGMCLLQTKPTIPANFMPD